MVDVLRPSVPAGGGSARAAGADVAAPRLPSLTGIRFVAAGMVFAFHMTFAGLFLSQSVSQRYFSVFFQGGWTGVGFFFVLSGFVLAWSRRPGDTAPALWRRRLVKIYPNHLITFGIAFLVLTYVTKASIDGRSAIANLFLVHAFFPQAGYRYSMNEVTWSLSCELLFYLAFPLLMALVARIRPERLWAWAAGLVAAIVAMPSISSLLPAGPALPPMGVSDKQMWFLYQFPPVRMLDFVFGIVMARIVLTQRRLPFGLGGAAAFAVAAYALAPLFPPTYHFAAVMVLPLGLLIAAAAANDVEGRPTVLSTRVAVWLGEISFAFYLWQGILNYIWPKFHKGHGWNVPTALGVYALLVAATVVASWLLYALVERPTTRRFSRPRKRTTSVPVGTGVVVTVPAPAAPVDALREPLPEA